MPKKIMNQRLGLLSVRSKESIMITKNCIEIIPKDSKNPTITLYSDIQKHILCKNLFALVMYVPMKKKHIQHYDLTKLSPHPNPLCNTIQWLFISTRMNCQKT